MSESKKVKVGVIGCGKISSIYFQAPRVFESFEIVACADLIRESAEQQAAQFEIPKVLSVPELLEDEEIEVILNLTIPQAHAEIGLAALNSGKAVYSEKPLGLDRIQGQELLNLGKQKNLLVGSAPDTFLGGGIQTCVQLINEGAIGEPVAATAFFAGHGPEGWHPAPGFFYQPGAGPLFDMGPYYLTTLIALMGPIKRVTGMARITFPERMIRNQLRYGEIMKVNTPTHVSGSLQFANGAIATLLMSFDVWHHELPRIEIYGSEGTLRIPDPNAFSGPVLLRGAEEADWREIPIRWGYTENSRGIGLADMAVAMRAGHQPRANGQMAYHVLDIMQSIYESADQGRVIEIESTCQRPAALVKEDLVLKS